MVFKNLVEDDLIIKTGIGSITYQMIDTNYDEAPNDNHLKCDSLLISSMIDPSLANDIEEH